MGLRSRREPATELLCVNCDDPLTGPGAVARGPDTAWHAQCLACQELVAGQMVLVADRPGGALIQIYECRFCGTPRACRPNWTTRCHVCLDDRSTGEIITTAARDFLGRLAAGPRLSQASHELPQLGPADAVSSRQAVEASALITLTELLHRFDRPGWSVLAADIHGLPWFGVQRQHYSHGTWARHDACGTVAKLHAGSVD